ncbi:MAG: glycosyltransferase, partial [Planctomycetota bacterium]
MRIAVFTDTYHPQVNGLVTSIDSNLLELPKHGCELLVYAPWIPGAEAESHVRHLLGFVYTPQPEYTFVLPWGRGFSLRRFARERVDLIHSHATWGAGIVAYLASKIWRKPLILTYHTFWEHYLHYSPLRCLRIPLSIQRMILRWITRRFCNPCKLVLAPTQAIRKALLNYGVTAPIEVMPTGLTDDAYQTHPQTRERIRKRYGIPEGARLISSGGRLGEEKNFHLLLEAVSGCDEALGQLWVVLVGDGPGRENLRRQADRLGLEERVVLTGYVERSEAMDIFEASDLLVFPSTTETQGMVVLEALARMTPVVAADALGPGEILAGGQAGWLAEPKSVESLGRCMEEAFSDPELTQGKVKEGRRLAESYSASAINERLAD